MYKTASQIANDVLIKISKNDDMAGSALLGGVVGGGVGAFGSALGDVVDNSQMSTNWEHDVDQSMRKMRKGMDKLRNTPMNMRDGGTSYLKAIDKARASTSSAKDLLAKGIPKYKASNVRHLLLGLLGAGLGAGAGAGIHALVNRD